MVEKLLVWMRQLCTRVFKARLSQNAVTLPVSSPEGGQSLAKDELIQH